MHTVLSRKMTKISPTSGMARLNSTRIQPEKYEFGLRFLGFGSISG